MPTSNSCWAARRITEHFCANAADEKSAAFLCGLPEQIKTPRSGGFTAPAGVLCCKKILLLVFVDLDITRGVFILPEQQNGGQGDSQRGEDGEQSFENFHGLVPPCEVRERSGGRSANIVIIV